MEDKKPEFITYKEALRIVDYHRSHGDRLRNEGKFVREYRRPGGGSRSHIRFIRHEVEDWMRGR